MHATDSAHSQPVTGESERPVPTGSGATLAEAAPRNENSGSNEAGNTAGGVADTLEASGAAEARNASDAVDRQAALRALRNLEATEARLARNAKRDVEEARGKLVQELLPVLDNLDRTIRAAYAARSEPAMLEGVRMVRHQLESVLRGYGVERIESLDQRFDPNLHEAIGVAPVSDPRRHGVVVQQAEPGYTFGGKLLRPAKVSVGKLVAPPPAVARPVWR
jgi:molecular chaperone GrpE